MLYGAEVAFTREEVAKCDDTAREAYQTTGQCNRPQSVMGIWIVLGLCGIMKCSVIYFVIHPKVIKVYLCFKRRITIELDKRNNYVRFRVITKKYQNVFMEC